MMSDRTSLVDKFSTDNMAVLEALLLKLKLSVAVWKASPKDELNITLTVHLILS